MLTDERSRRAVEVAEAFADGRASDEELQAASRAATRAAEAAAWAAREAARAEWATASRAEWAAAEEASRAERAAERAAEAAEAAWATARAAAAEKAAGAEDRDVQADLLRCIFGDPFNLAPPIRVGGTARRLAEAIYEERAFDRLPILADMLEEAGLTDPAILRHCRGGGPHARGCFVLDLILRPEA